MLFLKLITVFVFFIGTNSVDVQNNEFHSVNEDLMHPPFYFWPPADRHMNSLKKREVLPQLPSEGGGAIPAANKDTAANTVKPDNVPPPEEKSIILNANTTNNNSTNELITVPPSVISNETKTNTNSTTGKILDVHDISRPGVVKRGLIVFGGFGLLAVAYFIFYRVKRTKTDNINLHSGAPDSLQFRYGVLQSNERDNLDFSRVPLTMESDDDDDDDLEIFDLEQKKKSLSYVNLRTTDDIDTFSIVNENSQVEDNKENLLLVIDDKNT